MTFSPKQSSSSWTSLEEQNLKKIESSYDAVFDEKKMLLLNRSNDFDRIQELQFAQDSIRANYKSELHSIDPDFEAKDSDYTFLTFILNFLPHGLIGLLLAVIFSAAMSSTAGELNALAATTTIDYYKKFWAKEDNDERDLKISKLLDVEAKQIMTVTMEAGADFPKHDSKTDVDVVIGVMLESEDTPFTDDKVYRFAYAICSLEDEFNFKVAKKLISDRLSNKNPKFCFELEESFLLFLFQKKNLLKIKLLQKTYLYV